MLRHAVAPLLEVIGKLHGGRVPAVCARSQEYFRDVHDHLARINGAIDESETTQRLAAWAAIFAVSTALAGIWGMNFDNMPELNWKFGHL